MFWSLCLISIVSMKVLNFIKKYEFPVLLVVSITMHFTGYSKLAAPLFLIALISITMREFIKRRKR